MILQLLNDLFQHKYCLHLYSKAKHTHVSEIQKPKVLILKSPLLLKNSMLDPVVWLI